MNNKSKKILLLSLVALTVLLVLGFVISKYNNPVPSANDGSETDTSSLDTSDNSSSVDNPSTNTDTLTNEKAAIIEKNENSSTSTNTNGKQNVAPVIVYAGVFGSNLEISAYAPVVETGGSCTATVTNVASGKLVTKQGSATPSASTADCELLAVPISQLEPGKHNVTVSYTSDKSEGTSSATEVTIP